MTTIRAGLIGANPDRGWGSAVHVPVLRHHPDFELIAVCTTRRETADRSAARFGARYGFDDPGALATHPDVDLVVVAVKAPDHHRLVMAALAAGKHVYCEWPLAVTPEQARDMAAAARRRGVRAMIGLQARGAPALRRLRDLVLDGYVGRVTAVRLRCALPGGGGRRSREGLYVISRRNGAGTLEIQGGHAIDALQFCTGPLTDRVAIVDTCFREVEVIETGERCAKDAPDQILVSGRNAAGAVVSIAINGGVVAGHGIALEVFGDRGTLAVQGEQGLGFQMSALTLLGAQSPERSLSRLAIPDRYDPLIIPAGETGQSPYPGVSVSRDTLVNVANLYDDLGRAILHGAPVAPSFDDALALHGLLRRLEGRTPFQA